ncbi:benzyl alcohol O-benzoyltransferase-like [Senna tora]|uniref:Benzyl alcohol O-benzoyltransferase-like n=1 Tax=Senna tora TaxID=362788 RepID=A0A834TJ46_9FABA|nr:benzyl alcohol O-benzoyltransferase-like [Senna tora]
MELEPNDEVRFMCVMNARGRSKEIPEGYNGNAFVYPAVVTTAGKLIGGNSIEYALELVKKAKSEMSEEYVQSVADLMVIRGDVDFGWGKAVFGGVPEAGGGGFPGLSLFCSHLNAKGEEGIVIPLCLPFNAMQRFVKELESSGMIVSSD